MHILLGVTGSYSTAEINELISAFQAVGHEVKVVATKNAMPFLRGKFPLGVDFWDAEKVPDINLCTWSDILVVAPLSANTLAKFANGLCDDLLTTIFLSWDFNKPVILSPEMKSRMWENMITKSHLTTLKQFLRDNGKPSVSITDSRMWAQVVPSIDDIEYVMEEVKYIVMAVNRVQTK